MEIWKDIEGYEGLYKVSNYGNVKSIIKSKDLIMKPHTNNRYPYVFLCKNGKKKLKTIHRLVAIAFIPNTLNKMEVNHIDGNRRNNYANNLEWCTRSENVKHAYAIGLQVVGDRTAQIEGAKRAFSVKVAQYTKTGKFVNDYYSANEAHRQTGISQSHISACCRGVGKTAGGYIWERS